MSEFNLERMLAGYEVIDTDGKNVNQITVFKHKPKNTMIGVVDGINVKEYTKDGHSLDGKTYLLMKPEWDEKIPEQGVLCWISEDDIVLIKTAYQNESTTEYSSDNCGYIYAEPLTREELNDFNKDIS